MDHQLVIDMATPNTSNIERLAVLENELKNVSVHLKSISETHHENYRKISETLSAINVRLDTLDRDITHYKGFVGGIALVLSGIGILLTFFKTWLFTKMGIN